MASVNTVKELFENRSGKENDKGRFYTRKYQIKMLGSMPDPSDPEVILEDSRIPNIGDRFPGSENDTFAICNDVDCKPHVDNITWEVVATYGPADVDEMDFSGKPWDKPPAVSFGSNSYNRVLDRAYARGKNWYGDIAEADLNGDSTIDVRNPNTPVTNSATDPFDPPSQQEFFNQVITIVKNQDKYDPNHAAQYQGTINRKKIKVAGVTIDIAQGRLLKYSGDKRVEGKNNIFWEVTYVIEVNKETHHRFLFDIGFYTTDGEGENLKKIVIKESDINSDIEPGTDDDTPVEEPQKLYLGSLRSPTQEEDPFYVKYQSYFATDWSVLNLPKEQ